MDMHFENVYLIILQGRKRILEFGVSHKEVKMERGSYLCHVDQGIGVIVELPLIHFHLP
jgi:hypothetical protein